MSFISNSPLWSDASGELFINGWYSWITIIILNFDLISWIHFHIWVSGVKNIVTLGFIYCGCSIFLELRWFSLDWRSPKSVLTWSPTLKSPQHEHLILISNKRHFLHFAVEKHSLLVGEKQGIFYSNNLFW